MITCMEKISDLTWDFIIPLSWMEIIEPLLPRSAWKGGRKPLIADRVVLSAIFYILSTWGQWRKLPLSYGNWHTIYTRWMRWSESWVFHRILSLMIQKKFISLQIAYVDSTTVRAHHASTGALKKRWAQSIWRSRWWNTTKIHMIAFDEQSWVSYCLSPGNDADSTVAYEMLLPAITDEVVTSCAMDRWYDPDAIREQLREQGVEPVIPWRKNRIQPIEYDKQKYKWRNKVERLFHRLKNFRRIATRYEKLDIHFCSFLSIWLLYLMMQKVC